MNKTSDNFRLGQELFNKGFKYHQINKELGGTVNNEVYCGFEEMNRITRCGYSTQYWNKEGGYKTSSDISTLFT